MKLDELTIGEAKELAKLFGGQTEKDRVISDGGIRIVVLQRGWVLVGRYSQRGSDCLLENCSVVRIWGTSKGLGEIAKNGPIEGKTILDKTPTCSFHELTVCFTMRCEESKWADKLQLVWVMNPKIAMAMTMTMALAMAMAIEADMINLLLAATL